MKQFENPLGATPLDPEEMEGLKLKYITTRGELDRWEQENIGDAMDWLERRRKGDILTEEFAKSLHQKMFGKVWTWAGTFRKSDKNIGVDWRRIGIDYRQLCDDIRYWIEHKTYTEDEITARFHHRLVAIHLFPNGNGRHARLMADVLLKDAFEKSPFTWGNENLSSENDVRKKYIAALHAADSHDYEQLNNFVRS